MACEYLILNASDINIQDFDGQTPLFFATHLGKFYYIFIFTFLPPTVLFIVMTTDYVKLLNHRID